MDEETKEREEAESDTGAEGGEQSEASAKASEHEDADKEAEEKVKALEDDPPESLEDWPDDQAKYKTFGGPDDETGYEEGATAKLGKSDVRYHDDGSVSVGGEKVDNPDEYKGEPIPGGPTDPNTPKVSGEQDLTDETSVSTDSDDSDEDDQSDESEKDD